MRYYTNGNRYSSAFLRDIGRTAYANMRQNPVAKAGMERGKAVHTYVDDDIDVQVRISKKSEGPDVSVIERGIDLVEVNLPKAEHWADQFGVVDAPPWLELVTTSTLMDHSFNELEAVFACHFTLAQIAQVQGNDIQELADMVTTAHSAPTCFADQVLAASVAMNDDDPGEWDVDIRGFALSMVITQSLPNRPKAQAVGDSFSQPEKPAE